MRTPIARPPFASIRVTTDRSASASRAARTTDAPAAAKASAVAAPIPLLAPATSATRSRIGDSVISVSFMG